MRLNLIVQTGSLAGHQKSIESGSILLGRGDDCTLRFDFQKDPGVSTHHAIIQSDPNGFFIADQKSTNGTLLNGQAVESAWLNSGDVIQLGQQGPRMQVNIQKEAQAPVSAPQPQAQEAPRTMMYGGAAGAPAQPGMAQPGMSQGAAFTQSIKRTFSNLSAYNPEKEEKKAPNYVGIVVGVGIAALMSLIVMVIMFMTIGPIGAIVGGIMAFLPAPFYLLIYLWMDRYDPEPPIILAIAFAWGGLFAVIVSFVINTIFGSVAAAMIASPEAGNALSAIISAPFIEELTKGIGVLLIMIFFRKEFDGVLDGIVYAGVTALGFATVENVLYYGRTFAGGGFGALLFIGFLRGVLSPFCHSLFTSMTGIGCGIARESHNKAVKFIAPVAGLFGAMFLHALWNGIASLLGNYFYFAYFIVWVPLFLIFLVVIFMMARRERNIIKRTLAFEVASGLISPPQLDLAASMFKRLQWIMSTSGNFAKLKARRKFLRSVTKLAFCYWHVERANAAGNQTISLPQIPKFRSEVKSLQSQI